MPAASGPSARERIINAANLLFASSVPVFASSTSHFDVVASTTSDRRGIQVKLQQWHRVGDTSLRCVIAIVGPPKSSYRDALNALAEELDLMVAQSTTRHQQTFTPIHFSNPVPALAMMAGNSDTSPRTPTAARRRQDLPPSFLTPRANSASMAQSPRSRSSSTSSTSTIRPSTAPPGPGLPHTHTNTRTELEALPSIPPALPPVATARLTPKRSLTTRLTPFLRRQQRDAVQPQPQQQQQQLQPQTPSALHQPRPAMEHRTPSRQQNQHQHQPQRKPSTLHKLGSLIKTNREQQQQPQTPPAPRYMLAPDQGPSPSPSPSPSPPLKNWRRAGEVRTIGMRLMTPIQPPPVRQMTTMPPPPTTSMTTTATGGRPRGPRELPQMPFGSSEQQRRTSSHDRPVLFAERSPAVRIQESNEWRRTSSSRDSREYQQQQFQIQPAVVPPWKGAAPRDAAAVVGGGGTKPARCTEQSALSNIDNMPAPAPRHLQRKPVAYGKYDDSVLAPAPAAAESDARASKTPSVWEEIDEWKEELLRDRERDRLRLEAEAEQQRRRPTRLTWHDNEPLAERTNGEGNDDDDDDWDDEAVWQHPGPPPPRSPARRPHHHHHPWPPLRSSGSSGLRTRSSVDGKQEGGRYHLH